MSNASAPYSTRPSERTLTSVPQQASRRRTLLTALVMALLGAGVWFLIGEAANYQHLLHAIVRARPEWLIAAVAAAMFAYPGYALLYRASAGIAYGPRPGLRLTLRVTVAVFGASVLATSAGRLGSEYWTLRRMREKPAQAWSRVLAINIGAWAILAGLVMVGAALLLAGSGGHHAPLGVEVAWLLTPPLCVLPALYLSSPARRGLTEDRGGPIRRTFASAIRALVLLRLMSARRIPLARALPGGVLYWGAELLTVWCALQAFGVHLSYGALVVGYATGFASTMLPLPAGGVGGVDAASTFALTLVGVPLGPALLGTLVQRLCTYWLPLAIALLAAPALKRLGTELARVPRPAPGSGRNA